MGAFLVRQVDRDTGVELARFLAPNFLAHEGARYVLRQIFPPYDSAMTFQLGICGVNTGYPDYRPNPGGGGGFGPDLTFAQVTDANANEGGCYTQGMRNSFGYARQSVAFAASLEADVGALAAPEKEFPNEHDWSPQAASTWNLPWTPDVIEQPPPEWNNRHDWEPEVGYPWQWPRKRCYEECDPFDPLDCIHSYMHQWDATGELDWLCDFRKIGGFPITLAFLIDTAHSKLIAAATFAAPVLLRPGTTLHVEYKARIFGTRVTRDFALRFAKYAFQKTGSRYDTIYCRPLLSTAPKPNRRTTYDDIDDHFHAQFAAVALSSWTYVAGPPPRVESSNTPQWTNSTGGAIGPFAWLATYGSIGGSNELMWVTKIDPPASVPNGDTLRVPGKVKFQLDGV
ncbi:MAG: hypothetical protein JNG88_09790 [Phycisphaerales bacterium]|nr:hypothetical protein [Phycisphaerales bacterium]